MKIAIVDDEEYWRKQIKETVCKYVEQKKFELDIYKSGSEYLKSGKSYDVTFMDIEMPEMDGFDTITTAKKLNFEGFFVILTTHIEMSRKGYLVNAFRYIDKSNLEKEMVEAINSIEVLLGKNKKIKVNIIAEGQYELMMKNIIYIETERHCILIHTKHGVKRCSNSMVEMEDLLKDECFYRCHNAFIVNLDEIKCFRDKIIFMSNGSNVDVSKRKIAEFKKVYLKRQYERANA